MKQRLMGIISFIANIILAVFIIYWIADENNFNGEELLILFILTFSCVSSIIYISWTKFGKKVFTELEKVENENQILKMKIEQNELNKKLENQMQS